MENEESKLVENVKESQMENNDEKMSLMMVVIGFLLPILWIVGYCIYKNSSITKVKKMAIISLYLYYIHLGCICVSLCLSVIVPVTVQVALAIARSQQNKP